ncbi:MAG: M3 family oligoendopeptidase [Planctomycetes bacterium]|nr:M3 family oligoendopeptidase [Planctomycetota bacterium]
MPDALHNTEEAPEFPRHFVAQDADFDAWETAEKYYRELSERAIASAEQFEQWLLDYSELDACFDEEGTRRYVAMTRQTDDAERERRYLHFLEHVRPPREPWQHKLRQKLIESAERLELPTQRYEVLTRSVRNAIELYREENIPLLVEDGKLRQQYQKITGGITCMHQGKELTLQQMGRYLEEPDRQVREGAWRLMGDCFLAEADPLDQLYEQMVKLRHQVALNAGCSDYREYAFKGYERFDYTPEDCLAFHEAIEQVVTPAATKLTIERQSRLGLDTLRPWDLAVDPENRAPLRPFETDEQLADGCHRIFHKVHAELGRVFDTLRARGALDLGSRKGKAPGGYQETFPERRLPFIFMNAVGTEGDVGTLLHEGGHAFHTWACRHEPLLAYRHYPIEFAEVASMSMECLAQPYVQEFFGKDASRARKRHFRDIITILPWIARVDAFQHYVYTNLDHDAQRRKDEWVKLRQRFDGHVDWSGLERYDRHSWHRKLHFFEVPFYYIEYGIAQLGALQVWLNSRKDYEQAVALYRNGLALGGARPLPELFEAAGCKFDFTEATLRPLIDAVMEEIERL